MMDTNTQFLLIGAALVIVALAAGFFAGRKASPAVEEAKKLKQELEFAQNDSERVHREHEAYKTSVNSHFRKTADLVGQMTRSYAAVYDHLSDGARSFCDGVDSTIPFGPLADALAAPVVETAAEAVVMAEAEPEAASAHEVASSAGDTDGMELGAEFLSDSQAMDLGCEAALHATAEFTAEETPESTEAQPAKSAH